MGWNPTQFCGGSNKPLSGSLLTNQHALGKLYLCLVVQKPGFFVWSNIEWARWDVWNDVSSTWFVSLHYCPYFTSGLSSARKSITISRIMVLVPYGSFLDDLKSETFPLESGRVHKATCQPRSKTSQDQCRWVFFCYAPWNLSPFGFLSLHLQSANVFLKYSNQSPIDDASDRKWFSTRCAPSQVINQVK